MMMKCKQNRQFTADAALVKLLIVRFRAGVRHRWRELKTLRGLLFLCITVAVIILLMKQLSLTDNPFMGIFRGSPDQLRENILQYMPLSLLAACLLTVFTSSGPALYFNPSEINLLFSGPFSRRGLLLYKTCFYIFGALLSSLLIALLAPGFAHNMLASFMGAFLTLMFIQLFSAVIRQGSEVLLAYFSLPLKRAHIIIFLAVVISAIAGWLTYVAENVADAFVIILSSPIFIAVLAPFDVFVRIFFSPSVFPELLGWSLLGIAINAAVLATIIWLDKYAYESSLASSLKSHKRWAAARHSGQFWGTHASTANSFKPPPLLSGIGPIAWRQMVSVLRTSGKPVLVFICLALLAGPLLVIAAAEISIWSRIGVVVFVAVYVVPRSLVFDFRSDLNIIENLKVLPVAPWKIGVGQLVVPVLITCLIDLILLASMVAFLNGPPRIICLGLMPFVIPFNLLLYGLENMLFLLFPTPLVPIGRVDFDFLGRTMVEFMVKTTLLTGACAVAASIGYKVYAITNHSWPVTMGMAWFSLTAIALLMLPLLGKGFKRFDVSRN